MTALKALLHSTVCCSADAYYCVVDLHAITVPHDPVELRTATRTVAATYMAAGIDPNKVGLLLPGLTAVHNQPAVSMWPLIHNLMSNLVESHQKPQQCTTLLLMLRILCTQGMPRMAGRDGRGCIRRCSNTSSVETSGNRGGSRIASHSHQQWQGLQQNWTVGF